ncbi:hypothetical protein F5Y14DRAFT_464383 [Nemania sp. NC0429]|nr:hypothetical protein F5Y14DRAFT_464383 [Nemania sp. NC0429]
MNDYRRYQDDVRSFRKHERRDVKVSIGDGILLAQIAWRLAKTFSTGRQSAPAEFQELANELYALSTALTAAENEHNNSRSPTNQAVIDNPNTATQDVFKHIIQNCKQILTHLEDIVNRYMIVSEKTDPEGPKLKRWRESIARNWKKVEWTTERGDLNTLRSQIVVHINSLNLLVTIGTSSRTASIEQSLDKKLKLLEELHQWCVVNLKETVPKRSAASGELINASEQSTPTQSSTIISTFELSKRGEAGNEIICHCVSLRDEWFESFLDSSLGVSSGCMFACRCLDYHVGIVSHQVAVQRYGLSHIIFPIRIASDDRSWMLFKTGDTVNNQLVDLYIRKIHPNYLSHLEDNFFRALSSDRGNAMLARGAENSLCYISPDDQEQRILEAMSDLTISPRSVESVTFKSGQTRHVRELVDDVQILHYEVLDGELSMNDPQSGPARWLEYAEVVISFSPEDAQQSGDVISVVLKLTRNTFTKLNKNACVDIMSIEAVGTHSNGQRTPYHGLDITIQFTTKAAAEEFYENIEAMRTELFIKSLRYPRSNEKVVLNLQAARVECEDVYIDDAEITIVVDTDAKYRLIITSHNRCTIISQVLVDTFFTFHGTGPNYTGSTYLVQIDDTGKRRIFHYKNGFRHLSLSTTQGNRMLELARNSVSFGLENGEQ